MLVSRRPCCRLLSSLGLPQLVLLPPQFGTWCNPELCRHQAALRGLDLPNTPWPVTHSLPHHPLGNKVCFRAHRYLDKRSLSVIKCVSGSERGEAVGSALVPVINGMINYTLSVFELQFGPRKCIGDSNFVQKIRQCFHFFQKKVSWWANTGVFTMPEQKSGVWWSLSLVFHSISRKWSG